MIVDAEVKLFDADGEIHVGDIVRYGGKPCIVERIGPDCVTVVTMDERKYTCRVLPYQIGCVFNRGGE